MTHKEVISVLGETGIPFAYDHFAEGESPDPPFLCFLYPDSDNFGADDTVYFHRWTLEIELYTDAKDPELEVRVESVLESHDLYWDKSETWIPSENLYEINYTIALAEDSA